MARALSRMPSKRAHSELGELDTPANPGKLGNPGKRLEVAIYWDEIPMHCAKYIIHQFLYDFYKSTSDIPYAHRLICKSWNAHMLHKAWWLLADHPHSYRTLRVFPNIRYICMYRMRPPANFNLASYPKIQYVRMNEVTLHYVGDLYKSFIHVTYLSWQGSNVTRTKCLAGLFERLIEYAKIQSLSLVKKEMCCAVCVPLYRKMTTLTCIELKQCSGLDPVIIRNLCKLPALKRMTIMDVTFTPGISRDRLLRWICKSPSLRSVTLSMSILADDPLTDCDEDYYDDFTAEARNHGKVIRFRTH